MNEYVFIENAYHFIFLRKKNEYIRTALSSVFFFYNVLLQAY